MTLNFIVRIKPQAKERPRFAVVNGKRITYTSHKTRAFETIVRNEAKKKIKKAFDCELSLKIDFFFKKPNKPSRGYPSKGDLDNYLKAVMDSFNGVVFKDDSQVSHIECSKKYGSFDVVSISVKPLPCDNTDENTRQN